MWLADFLFGAKKFKFTSLPKDDPPDGSMQFASCLRLLTNCFLQIFCIMSLGPTAAKATRLPLNWASKSSKPCADLAKC